jgi:hypothetical protein
MNDNTMQLRLNAFCTARRFRRASPFSSTFALGISIVTKFIGHLQILQRWLCSIYFGVIDLPIFFAARELSVPVAPFGEK